MTSSMAGTEASGWRAEVVSERDILDGIAYDVAAGPSR
jgi:hypothetical protein